MVAIGFEPSEESFIGLVLENSATLIWHFESDELNRLSSGYVLRKPGQICHVAFALHPNKIAIGYESGQIHLLSFTFNPKRVALNAEKAGSHLGRVLALGFTQTNIYSGGSDGTVLVTKLSASEEKPKEPLQSKVLLDGLGAMTTLAVSQDNQLLACGNDDGEVQVWRLTEDKTQACLDWTSRKQHRPIKSLSFSPNGNILVTREADGHLCLRAARTGYELPLAPEAQHSCVTPAFAADSRLLATINSQNYLVISDAWTGSLRHTLPSPLQNTQNLVFAPDIKADSTDAHLAIANSQEVEVWQVPLHS